MIDRAQWLRTRKELTKQIKNQVASRLALPSKDFHQYVEEYKREFLGEWKACSKDDLHRAVSQAQVILGGDFHAFSQSQRVHLRILRSLPSQSKVTLALECFEAAHQEFVDSYMKGSISEEELQVQVDWQERWGFLWDNYKPLLELAKKRGYPVVGINRFTSTRSDETLTRRDIYASHQIIKQLVEHPDHLIYVVFGDLHLASAHLPHWLESHWQGEPLRIVKVFQNSEKLYFSLAEQQMETSVEVLKGTDQRFCVLGSPPWVKWQSYLMYLEHVYDVDLDEGEEGDDVDVTVDYTDHVVGFVKLAAKDLGIQVKPDDLAVYSAGQSQFWDSLVNQVTEEEVRSAEVYVQHDKSFYLPQYGFAYLSRATINHAASLAGYYLQAKLSGRRSSLWEMPKNFKSLIWVEAVGFFVSKLVNHKRKAETIQDIKTQLGALELKDKGREPLMLALDQRMAEVIWIHSGRKRHPKIQPRQLSSYPIAARILGHMLGEKLFQAYDCQRLGRSTLLEYLSQSVEDSSFNDFYMFVVQRLESQVEKR